MVLYTLTLILLVDDVVGSNDKKGTNNERQEGTCTSCCKLEVLKEEMKKDSITHIFVLLKKPMGHIVRVYIHHMWFDMFDCLSAFITKKTQLEQ